MRKKLPVLTFLCLCLASDAWAYIDPGTATAVGTSIGAWLLAGGTLIGGAVLKYFWRPFLRLLGIKERAQTPPHNQDPQ